MGVAMITDANQRVRKGVCFDVLPLAAPKGKIKMCELCGKPAILGCSKCSVTFYCSWDHHRLDRLHPQICKRLKLLRFPLPMAPNGEERSRQQFQKVLVMEKLLEELVRASFILMYKGEYTNAASSLWQIEKYVPSVYLPGYGDLHLITTHTAMCEAYTLSNDLVSAESSLNKAIDRLKSAMDRVPRRVTLNYAQALIKKAQGHLNYAQGDYEEAIYYFSEYIYHVAEVTSPEHIRTCTGYFHLAKSFLAAKKSTGFAILSFCIELWLKYLRQFVPSASETSLKTAMLGKVGERTVPLLLGLEANYQLQNVRSLMGDAGLPGIDHKVIICQGILLFINKKYDGAKEKARLAAKKGHNTKDHDFLQLCKNLERHCTRKLHLG